MDLFKNEEFKENILQYLSINDTKYLNKNYYRKYKIQKMNEKMYYRILSLSNAC